MVGGFSVFAVFPFLIGTTLALLSIPGAAWFSVLSLSLAVGASVLVGGIWQLRRGEDVVSSLYLVENWTRVRRLFFASRRSLSIGKLDFVERVALTARTRNPRRPIGYRRS